MKKGFTLIELMVVITVIAILATIALFGIGKAQAAARDVQRQQIMNGIRTALERYYGDNGTYYYSPNNFFCGLTNVLIAGNYLPSQPTDPRDKSPLCTAGYGTCANGSPICGGATYTYTGAAQSYTLTLTKESGGSSVFTNPQ